MTEVDKFTQPDSSPQYFIDFLDFLDRQDDIKRLRAEMVSRMRISRGQRVLDVGCGIGGASFAVAELTGPTGLVAGVDISSALLQVASDRARGRPGIEFRQGEAGALPYPDDCFDAARCERVFLYLPDRLAAIREMQRVVKKGGRICIVDTDIDSTAIHSAKHALTRKLTSVVAASIPNPNSARDLPSLAKQSGLRDIEVATFALSTPYEFFLRAVTGSLEKAVQTGTVSRGEVDDWMGEQAALQARGEFFHAWLFVLVCGTV
jgi:ubiquinone/menaquinone biosynthesis C-methylase UbiE